MPKWTKHLVVWMFLIFSMLLPALTARAAAPPAQALYLIAAYYELLPDGRLVPFAPEGVTERLLSDRLREGDPYCLPAPEFKGYRFRGELSSPLSGVFGTEDILLTLCYERAPVRSPRRDKTPRGIFYRTDL